MSLPMQVTATSLRWRSIGRWCCCRIARCGLVVLTAGSATSPPRGATTRPIRIGSSSTRSSIGGGWSRPIVLPMLGAKWWIPWSRSPSTSTPPSPPSGVRRSSTVSATGSRPSGRRASATPFVPGCILLGRRCRTSIPMTCASLASSMPLPMLLMRWDPPMSILGAERSSVQM